MQRMGVQGLGEQAMPSVPIGGAGAAWKAGAGPPWHADRHAACRLQDKGEGTVPGARTHMKHRAQSMLVGAQLLGRRASSQSDQHAVELKEH